MRKKDVIDIVIFLGTIALKVAEKCLDRAADNREIKKDLTELIEKSKKNRK